MNIPKKLKIGGVSYTVKFVDTVTMGNQVCYGKISYDSSAIELSNKNLGIQCKEMTFLHEILHGIAYQANLTITDEEQVIDTLAKGLHQVILDNPNVFQDREVIKTQKTEKSLKRRSN